MRDKCLPLFATEEYLHEPCSLDLIPSVLLLLVVQTLLSVGMSIAVMAKDGTCRAKCLSLLPWI